jgi:hypothetical protein
MAARRTADRIGGFKADRARKLGDNFLAFIFLLVVRVVIIL